MSSDSEDAEVPGGMGEVIGGAGASSRQPSRSDIAQAVVSRMQTSQSGESPLNEEAERQTKQKAKLRKLINEMTASVNYEKASACLRLIHTLLNNILLHPTEIKYRSFKAIQPKIARNIISLEEGRALLIEIGFRTRIQDFQQEWFVPEEWSGKSFGLKKIDWSRELINNKMVEFEENAERVRFNKEREKNVESTRKSRALEEAKEDRERVAIRAEREKIARKAIEIKALQAEKEANEIREAASTAEST